MSKKNTRQVRVHPEFNEYLEKFRSRWKIKVGINITTAQATKIILKRLRDQKIETLKKNKNLLKRRKHELFDKPI